MSALRKKLAPTWFPLATDLQATPPEFLLAPLTPLQWLDVRNEVYKTPAGAFKISARGIKSALEASLRDWRNVLDDKGQPIEFEARLVFDLHAEWIDELALEIANRAILSESERKNSSSPSTAH